MEKEVYTMRKIAKDIINTSFLSKVEIRRACKKFHDIMKKHGIKEGIISKDGNSRTVTNAEWTMFETLFLERMKNQLDFASFFIDVPKSLESY